MITIEILEDNDKVLPTDWCRRLDFDEWEEYDNEKFGRPVNNMRWRTVEQTFDARWFNKAVEDINDVFEQPFEFVRGNIPKYHQYGLSKQELDLQYERYLHITLMTVGKHKGKSMKYIRDNYKSYFDWAVGEGLIIDRINFAIEN